MKRRVSQRGCDKKTDTSMENVRNGWRCVCNKSKKENDA